MTPNPPLRAAARALVDVLAMHDVDRVFCVPARSPPAVLEALACEPAMRLLAARHEGAAAMMADADAKLTGRPGVCLAGPGPGVAHAAVGVHVARQDSTPMVLLAGEVARARRGRDATGEIDCTVLFGGIAKQVLALEQASRVPEILARAFHLAVTGRPGPVVVALPEDLLRQPCPSLGCRAALLSPRGLDDATRDRLLQFLAASRRPLVIVGGSGWDTAASAALRNFAARWNLPVACASGRQDAIDNLDPHYVGHLNAGMPAALGQRVRDADLVIALGSRLGDATTGGFRLLASPIPAQVLIHVHAESAEIGRVYQPTLAVEADVPQVLAALAAAPAPEAPRAVAWASWTVRARRDHTAFCTPPPASPGQAGVNLAEVVQHVSRSVPKDAIHADGAGPCAAWLHRFHAYRRPRTALGTSAGSTGYGVPAAVAAALRFPDRPVICMDGGGGFLMYPQELQTAVSARARVVVLLVEEGLHGALPAQEERCAPVHAGGRQPSPPDFLGVAQAFGAHGERVERTADFPAAFDRALARRGVALLELSVDPRQITPDARRPA